MLVYSQTITRIKLKGNGINYGKHHKYNGVPYLDVNSKGYCSIGNNFSCNNKDNNPIGRNTKSYIVVGPGASLKIGNYVGISNVGLNCQKNIEIGDYVKMGGGVVVYDSDFHSLDFRIRSQESMDLKHKIEKPVIIKEHAFIGAHSTILKGVTIGERSIVGACSVVTKNIPADEVWAGNPARFIRKIS